MCKTGLYLWLLYASQKQSIQPGCEILQEWIRKITEVELSKRNGSLFLVLSQKLFWISANRTENTLLNVWIIFDFLAFLCFSFLFWLSRLKRYVRRLSFYKYSDDNGGAILTIQTLSINISVNVWINIFMNIFLVI